MLFSYEYVPHSLDQLHVWVSHILRNVWCRKQGKYKVQLLLPELQEIAAKIHFKEAKENKPTIFDEILKLDILIQSLKRTKRDKLVEMFINSTAVEELCKGNPNYTAYNYEDLVAWDKDIAPMLKEFFNTLFSKHIRWGPIKNELGNLKNHVDKFCLRNVEGICPFCGLVDTRDKNDTTRDDYDHYLPRSKYPFNSVNFHNLAPMCSNCNKSYKTTKDPIRIRNRNYQKAYTPFTDGITFPQITISLNTKNIDKLQPSDINLNISHKTHSEEVNSWLWLFGIKERYRSKLCKKRGARAWLNTILQDSRNYNTTAADILKRKKEDLLDDALIDNAFLKVPTLEACVEAGIIPD